MLKSLTRRVTFLVLPPADLPPLRMRVSYNFILFSLVVWTALSLWTGFSAGQGVDYWLTKADNQVMRARMAFLAAEIDRSRAEVEKARQADIQLRQLLGMRNREAIIESKGTGGPTVLEQRALLQLFLNDPVHSDPALVHEPLQALRSESRLEVESLKEISAYIDTKRRLFRATPLGWPTRGRITSVFGYRRTPFLGDYDETDLEEFHPGLDIANGRGTPIYATADGSVRRAGWAGGYGRMVCLSHDFGYLTIFGHTSKVLVKPGERVRRGELIAEMGTTGRSTGSHLHYEIWRNGKVLNPRPFLNPASLPD